jgi:hypothetical protein
LMVSVMAGLVPAIHVLDASDEARTWITGTGPVMTSS